MTHLFMDDLKVYTRNPRALETALGVVNRVSCAVGMELGLQKCAVAHLASGRLTTREDFILLEDRHISAVANGNTYRYLGIEHVSSQTSKDVCETSPKDLVLGPQFQTQGPSNQRLGGLDLHVHLKWSQRDLELLYRKTRAVMRQYKSHHYGASVERVYLPRRWGGWGLQSLVHSWEREIISTAVYLVTSSDPHLVKHQLWLFGRNRYSNLQEAQRMIKSGVHMDQEPVPPRQVFKMVKTAQMGLCIGDLVSEEDPWGFLQAMPRARPGHLWVSRLAL